MISNDFTLLDLMNILEWYELTPKDIQKSEQHKRTKIKIQALAIYAKEDEDWTDKFFKRRMR